MDNQSVGSRKGTIKAAFSGVMISVNKKLDTPPKKMAAIIGGSAIGGALIVASVPVLALAAVGGLIGGAIGTAIAGAYGTYKGTKKAAEGLADSPKFQNAMGALSIGKIVKKVLSPIDKMATKAAFKKSIDKLNKKGKEDFIRDGKATTKLHPLLKENSNKPTAIVHESDSEYLQGEYEYTRIVSDDFSLKNLNKKIESMPFSKSETKEIKEILIKVADYDRYEPKYKDNLRKFQIQHPNQAAKLVMFLKLGDMRSKAKEDLEKIHKAADKDAKDNKETPNSMTKEFYKVIIKPIEHLYAKGKVRGSLKNIKVEELSFEDCEKIAKVAKNVSNQLSDDIFYPQ